MPNCSIVSSTSDCMIGCFDVVASGRSVTTTSLDVGEADLSVSEVINFRSGTVITPRHLSLQKQ
jgi:hypothetical protein